MLGLLGKTRRPAGAPAGRTGISPALFYAVTGFLLICNAFAATAFLMSADIAHLARGGGEQIVTAYQDRIADLRMEVDRLNSRQYARAGDLNLQIQDLVRAQETLLAQHQFVRALADKAEELGVVAALTAPMLTPHANNISNMDVDLLRQSIDSMLTESHVAMASIADSTLAATDQITAELRKIGLKPKHAADATAMGGPFEALTYDGSNTVGLQEANAILSSFGAFKAAKTMLDAAPVHRPVSTTRISSTFGARHDPFTKASAFHAGLDFPAKTGTRVGAAGPGEVIFAGRKSGYGNAIDIRHANGLVTRYGHLSKIETKVGRWVKAGQLIGRVGSTGRSTGPHLHFEVRRNDKPTDPAAFISVGKHLSAFL